MSLSKDGLGIGGARAIANILVASNGATTLNGKSSGLRTLEDAQRFHMIRKLAKAVLIGGNTYRSEPYGKSPIPVFVSSKTLAETSTSKLNIKNATPITLLEAALSQVGSPVIIEGGPRFLNPLITSRSINSLFISRVPKSGDGDFFDESELKRNYHLVESEIINDTVFEIWQPIN